jgi:hypothetical protein
MIFPTSMISLMVTFRNFPFLDFLADLPQKSISVASNLFACCVFSVHVSAAYSKILWTKAWYISFLVLWMIVLLHKTEFNNKDNTYNKCPLYRGLRVGIKKVIHVFCYCNFWGLTVLKNVLFPIRTSAKLENAVAVFLRIIRFIIS